MTLAVFGVHDKKESWRVHFITLVVAILCIPTFKSTFFFIKKPFLNGKMW